MDHPGTSGCPWGLCRAPGDLGAPSAPQKHKNLWMIPEGSPRNMNLPVVILPNPARSAHHLLKAFGRLFKGLLKVFKGLLKAFKRPFKGLLKAFKSLSNGL